MLAEVSAELASEYQERYGLDIPEWRVLATLGFRGDACTAQYIAHCTRTHKSTISRAVAHLLKLQIVERVENEDDRREFALQLTRKGVALYEELIPRLLRKEQDILSCLTAAERKDCRQRYTRIKGGRPHPDREPSALQLAGLWARAFLFGGRSTGKPYPAISGSQFSVACHLQHIACCRNRRVTGTLV